MTMMTAPDAKPARDPSRSRTARDLARLVRLSKQLSALADRLADELDELPDDAPLVEYLGDDAADMINDLRAIAYTTWNSGNLVENVLPYDLLKAGWLISTAG